MVEPSKTKPAPRRGTRTGISLPETGTLTKEGLEDFDAILKVAAEAKTPQLPSASPSSKKKKHKKEQRTKKNVRFSLNTAASDDGLDGTASTTDDGLVAAGNAASRKIVASSGRQALSPSDLSSVATAPPSSSKTALSPEEILRKNDDDDDNEMGTVDVLDHGVDATQSPLLENRSEEEDEQPHSNTDADEDEELGGNDVHNHEKEAMANRSDEDEQLQDKEDDPNLDTSEKEEEPQVFADDEEEDDDDVEDDELAPPAPADSQDPDPPEEVAGGEHSDSNQADFDAAVDYNDDDDKEGVGYQMASTDQDGGHASEEEVGESDYDPTAATLARQKTAKTKVSKQPRDEPGTSDDETAEEPRQMHGKNRMSTADETESSDDERLDQAAGKNDKKRKMPEAERETSDDEKLARTKKKKIKKKQESEVDDETSDEDDTERARKKKSKSNLKESKAVYAEDSDDEVDEIATSTKQKKRQTKTSASSPKPKAKRKVDKSKLKSRYFSPKGIAMQREFKSIPVTDMQPSSDEEGLRRSKRTRYSPLEFWKNERVIYGPNDFPDDKYDSVTNMPVPKAISRAEPTPYKPRKAKPSSRLTDEKKKTKKGKHADEAEQDGVEHFDSSKLRKKANFFDGTDATLWDDVHEEQNSLKVIAYRNTLQGRPLPLNRNRPKSEGRVVGMAAQAFNVPVTENRSYPGYIMGNLLLPPRGIKDAEPVGSCAQTFTVVSNQPGSLEVGFGKPSEVHGTIDPATAQRFLVGPGDMFRIPPGNTYRLQNHSRSMNAYLTWTIIRPTTEPDYE